MVVLERLRSQAREPDDSGPTIEDDDDDDDALPMVRHLTGHVHWCESGPPFPRLSMQARG